MSVLLVRKPMFYVTDSSINYLAVLESPLSKQENKMNVLNTVTHALTQNPAPDFHSVSVHWRHACQQVLQCIENRGETPPHAKKLLPMLKPLLMLNQITKLPFLF